MKIIFKIAWRNIWRNSRRSWVLISSIAVGVLGYLGTSSFSRGFLNQMVDTSINLQGGHIMISAKGYHENPNIRLFIRDPEEISERLEKVDGIQYAPLVSFQGMIASSERTAGVVVSGVDMRLEPNVTTIAGSVFKGTYFADATIQHPILLGETLAQRLKVDVGEKVVLMTSDLENNINSGAFRVTGVFSTPSLDFDKAFVFLPIGEAQSLSGYGSAITGFTLRLDSLHELDATLQELKAKLVDERLEILSWKDRNRLLVLALQLYDFSIVIMVIILFVAIAFSIANAFLMVIYERIHEIGIMMANGVLPVKVRMMLYVEALIIATLGTAVGLAATALFMAYFGHFGLDLSAFAQGLGKFGVGSVVYPAIVASDVIIGLVFINLIVFLSVVYPSAKASRFEPADAIRFT